MKKMLLLLQLLILFSCSEKDAADPSETAVGTWKLETASGMLAYSEKTGEDLPFKEYYRFNADGSFIKMRSTSQGNASARGIYSVKKTGAGKEVGHPYQLQLNFNKPDSIITSCTSRRTEHLYISHEGKLENTWEACDGLNLTYIKK